MVIKRSLSPDGRIDSLSIEVDFPVTETSRQILQERALKLIRLQDRIARVYLQGYLQERAHAGPPTNGSAPNGAAAAGSGQPQPATLLEIGGTKNGKLVATFELANRQRAKMFRPEKALAKELAALGIKAGSVHDGARLSVPCRVLTTRNGQYLNADRVFPLPTTP